MSTSPLRVVFPALNRTVEAERGDNLLKLMREAGIGLAADCGGVGRCGKCRVVVDGIMQLACLTHVMADTEVRVPDGRAGGGAGAEGVRFADSGCAEANADYAILTDYEPVGGFMGAAGAGAGAGALTGAAAAAADAGALTGAAAAAAGAGALTGAAADAHTYAIAIDLGTTTVVGKLLDLATGRECASFAQLNTQIPYGADVVSRIDVALDDASTLGGLITSQIDRAITAMLAEHQIAASAISKLVIAGNTTMSYLLLGLPCRSLGLAPFAPEYPLKDAYAYHDIFSTHTLDCDCAVVPYISAFIGGDITAGLVALRGEDDFILMDMGTNGELVFKRGDRLICTATATGPAFEGGNIECGCGSTRGAISAVYYEDGSFRYQTIGAAPARGICGSGILDLMAILVREGLVDTTGFMTEGVRDGRIILAGSSLETGAGHEARGDDGISQGATGARSAQAASSGEPRDETVFFTQKDVRQYQLAKGAVRAGLEVLMNEMGGDPPSKVFLAGGFGQNLNPESALATGLLPAHFAGRIVPVGNSSLSGTVKLCLNPAAHDAIDNLIANAQDINLATHPLFNDLFMESLEF